MTPALNRFRYVALAEGVSYLALLGVAMPLKYAFDMPMAVRVVGWIHGVLFMLYMLFGHLAASDQKWGLTFRVWVFGASLIPFGTFVLDYQLRKSASPETGSPAPE